MREKNFFIKALSLVLLAVGGLFLAKALMAKEGAGGSQDIAVKCRETIEYLSSLGSRVVGYPGASEAAKYIEAEFRRIGLKDVRAVEFSLPVPVDKGAHLQAPWLKAPVRLYCLWPNLVRTPTLPPEGLGGHLIYVQDGDLEDLEGKDLEGAIVLMDFNSGQNYLETRALGAQAIIFIEPPEKAGRLPTSRDEAEAKFLKTPVNIPRYWLPREEGDTLLKELSLRGDSSSGGGPEATLHARMLWEKATAKNIYGYLYSDDPEAELIVLEAHYDSISVVPALAPGAENACGITALLRIAEHLVQNPPKRNILFLATSGHFHHLAGISRFLIRHALRGGTIEEEPQERKLEHTRLSAPGEREVKKSQDRWLGLDRLELSFLIITLLLGLGFFVSIRISRVRRRGEGSEVKGTSGFSLFLGFMVIVMALVTVVVSLRRERPMPPEPLSFKLLLALDLSSHNDRLGVFYNSNFMHQGGRRDVDYRQFFKVYGQRFVDYAEEIKEEKGLENILNNCISPGGGRVWQSFIPGKIALDSVPAMRFGKRALSLVTVDDARLLVDSPLDLPQYVNYQNLAAQVNFLLPLMEKIIAAERILPGHKRRLEDEIRRLRGRVVEMNYREGVVPNTPVPGSLVAMRSTRGFYVEKTYMGVRGEKTEITGDDGWFEEPFVFERYINLEPFKLGEKTGAIIYAADRGEQGAGQFPLIVEMDRPEKETHTVVFQAEPIDIYALIDPRYLRALQKINVLNPTDAAPIEYGYSILEQQNIFNEPTEKCGVVFVKASTPTAKVAPIKVLMGTTIFGIQYLLINSDEESPLGKGFLPTVSGMIPRSEYQVARDMWTIDQFRIAQLDYYGISNERLRLLHNAARKQLLASELALAQKRYKDFRRFVHAARGYEAVAYPEVKATQNSTVQGIIFYFALLIPFALFAERLFFCFADIKKQIAAISLIFLAVFFILHQVHPAFKISKTPYMILLAFIILVLAASVLTIVMRKFNDQMAKMKRKAAKVHEADVGRLSASAAAFTLGISNMKKRKVRTALTTVTIILLTFTVLSFTSVKTSTRFNRITLRHKPAYHGFLVRDRNWNIQEDDVYRHLHLAFGEEALVIPRSWYVSNVPDEPLLLTIRAENGKSVEVSGAIGLRPEEKRAIPITNHLVAGSWFEEPEARVCILPSRVMTALGLTAEDVGRVKIRIFGEEFLLKGVLNSGFDKVYLSSPPPISDKDLQKEVQLLAGRGRSTKAKVEVGVSSDEAKGLGVEKLIFAGGWYSEPKTPECILPQVVAHSLGLDEKDIGKTKVNVAYRDYLLRGIFISGGVDDVKDLDGELISPLDVMQENPGFGSSAVSQETGAAYRQNITEIRTFNHLGMNTIIILPYEFLRKVGGHLRSVAVVYPEGVDFTHSLKRFMERVAMTLFVAVGDRVEAYSSIALSRFRGVGNIFVPILIAALIVLNTMMGAVYERQKEIGIYSSVGLAPVHIGSLFLAESCVYAVLGAISGYLIGQVLGKVITHYELLEGLTLNYSSMSTVMTTMLVMATVLLSTLYPSKMASDMSVPDVTRRWKFPEPKGDDWVFDFPFTVATAGVQGLFVFLNNYFDGFKEESIGHFYTDAVHFSTFEEEGGRGFRIKMNIWLAPFDMGISQQVELQAVPTEDAGITRIVLHIHRLSGDVSSWKRLNKGFLTEIRKQFLIWRTVPAYVKEEYNQQGIRLLDLLRESAPAT